MIILKGREPERQLIVREDRMFNNKEKKEILAAMEKDRIARVGISPPQVGDMVQQWTGGQYSLPFFVSEANFTDIQERGDIIVVLRAKDVDAARKHFQREYIQKLTRSKSDKKTASSRVNSKKGGRTQIRSTDTWISTKECSTISVGITVAPARYDDQPESTHPLLGLLELHEKSDGWCIFYRRRRSDKRWQSSEWAPMGQKQTTVAEAAAIRKVMLNQSKMGKEGHHAE